MRRPGDEPAVRRSIMPETMDLWYGVGIGEGIWGNIGQNYGVMDKQAPGGRTIWRIGNGQA